MLSAHDQVHMRVLVVDDNHTNRQILRNQVGAWKMQVGSAASGEEALDDCGPPSETANRTM